MENTQFLLEGIQTHPYVALLLFSMVETRVTAIFVGALVAYDYIGPVVPYMIFIAMNIMSDTLYYYVGRAGTMWGKFLITPRLRGKIQGLSDKIQTRSLAKVLLFGKITAIGAKPAVVVAGMGKMPLVKFYSIIVPCNLLLFLFYMGAGYFIISGF